MKGEKVHKERKAMFIIKILMITLHCTKILNNRMMWSVKKYYVKLKATAYFICV